MKYNKIQGLILSLKQLKESDKLVVVFSREKGKIKLLARGANKVLSRKSYSLDILNLVEFLTYPTKTEWNLIIEVKLIDEFSTIKKDFASIKICYYFLELLNNFLVQETESEEIYIEFLSFLQQLSKLTSKKDKLLLAIYFQLKILNSFGFKPQLFYCVDCQSKLLKNTPRILSSEDMLGYLCEKHFDIINFSDNLISDDLLKIQRYLTDKQVFEITNLKIDILIIKKILEIQNKWLEIVSQRTVNSYNLLARNYG